VLGSRLTVHVTPTGTTQGSILKYCISPRTETGVPTAWSVQLEQPYTKMTGFTSLVSGGGNVAGKPLSMYMSTRKMFGISEGKAADEDYSAEFNSSPARQWYWQVTVSSADESTVVGCLINVELEYDVICYEREEVATS